AYAYAMAGQRRNAERVSAPLEGKTDADSRAALAVVQIAMGDTASALTNLEAASRAHSQFLFPMPLGTPIFDPVRSSARFRGILSAMGLTP
ncbi:MAG: hypothetical protein AABZ80_08080, partial [Gemmatimonadota bacterium]